MSVIKSKRNESVVEYINTARELCEFTVRECTKMPKRYTFFICQDLSRCAVSAYEHAIKADKIYPRNQHELQVRRDHLTDAIGNLDAMVGLIEICERLFGIDKEKMCRWMELVHKEIGLLSGVKRSDDTRYKQLKSV